VPPVPPPAAAAAAAAAIQDLVACFVKALTTSAVDAINAAFQLAADIRAVLGIPWAGPRKDNTYAAEALLPYSSILVLLKQSLSHSSLSAATVPLAVGNALAAGFSRSEFVPLAVMLQSTAPALTLADVFRPDYTEPTPLQKAVTALVAVSLWALISAALPGLGGLFACGATGVRIGYRQANARAVLHSMEFARFARPGPIGIVRTGSLVAVHPQAVPAEHTAPRQHLRLAS
jgi:hypothetical protein